MFKNATFSTIVVLLLCAVVITVVYSYLPLDMAPVRQILSWVQLGFMAGIATLTLKWVFTDF